MLKLKFLLLQLFCLYFITNTLSAQRHCDSIQAIVAKLAPDKRLELANIYCNKTKRTYYITGETTNPNIVKALQHYIMSHNIKSSINIQILPDTTEHEANGLIRISVANLRKNPRHQSELVSQATMGTPIKIIKDSASHYLIQTPDLYLGWTTKASIQPLNKHEHKQWKASNRQIVTVQHTQLFADTCKQNIISDITMGSIIELIDTCNNMAKVRLPDRREAYIDTKEITNFEQWAFNIKPSAQYLADLAQQHMGVSYLWGGTSSKMLDCSGLMKIIYFMNGIILARDASQQINQGKSIKNFNITQNLEKGDLLFFGSLRNNVKRITHVGMVLQNDIFIHESEWVRVNSLNPNSQNYSEYYSKRLLGAQRILNNKTIEQLSVKNNNFYF